MSAPGPPVVTLAAEPDVADVGLRAKERAENFPVALRVLPRAVRADLRAVYDVVRTVDDLGDELAEQRPGQRTAALEAFRADLARVWSTGSPASAVLTRLVPTVRRHSIPLDPFDRLVEANLADQRVTRYATFEDLLGYCDLSAAPIGELVLHIVGAATPEPDRAVGPGLRGAAGRRAPAGRRRGPRPRPGLPAAEDLAAHGVAETDLDAPTASPALRALVAALADRVDGLLDSGLPLVATLTGWSRLAVAGYVAGGRAALDGLRRADGDVLGGSPGVRRRDLLQHVAGRAPRGPAPRPAGAFPVLSPTLEQAYTTCEEITRTEARNFYYGIRLLPRDRRAALCAVYALARRVDDIGDGDPAAAVRRREARPAGRRARLGAVARRPAPTAGDPVLVALADAARRLPIPLGAFGELVDGVERDVEMDETGRGYADFDELVWYCRCVAGSIGRLCLGVFGARPRPRRAPATPTRSASPCSRPTSCATSGRTSSTAGCTCRRTSSTRFGVDAAARRTAGWPTTTARCRPTCGSPASAPQNWYDDGLRLVPLLDRRSAACCLAMSGIYRRLTDRIAADPAAIRDRRLSLSGREKAGVAARALTGRTR